MFVRQYQIIYVDMTHKPLIAYVRDNMRAGQSYCYTIIMSRSIVHKAQAQIDINENETRILRRPLRFTYSYDVCISQNDSRGV